MKKMLHLVGCLHHCMLIWKQSTIINETIIVQTQPSQKIISTQDGGEDDERKT